VYGGSLEVALHKAYRHMVLENTNGVNTEVACPANVGCQVRKS